MEIRIQNQKMELIQWLTTLNDESIVQKLIDLRNNQLKDWWNELSNAEIESIEKGIKDADNGSLVSHSEARKTYEKFL
jgi:predicted transcriptional regulator